MAGKFINTEYINTMDALVQMNEDLIKNPFYLFTDKKGTKVTYFNINMEKTTLDPGSKLAYTDIGDNSPIRFNVIYDLFLYQFIKAEINFDNTDFGLESGPIEGESYILPNTITPCDGDYFMVDHVKDSTWLFKVKDVDRDTLENGSNVFKISWILDRTTNRDILKNVVEEYQYVDVQEGTNVKAIVKLSKYDIAKQLDEMGTTLRSYFKDLFYSDKIQSFTYKWYNEYNMYDPFALEFVIRNKLLYGSGKDYIYIKQQAPLPNTFAIDYNSTIFRAFELCDKEALKTCQYQSQADYIDSPLTIFNTRYEDYYALNYHVYYNEQNTPTTPRGIIPIVTEDLLDHIQNNAKYTECKFMYYNIFVKYFNKEDIYKDDIECIQAIDFESVESIFYMTLFLIYCVDYYTKKLLS